jgi:sialic acid synthase SpsE
MVFAEEIRNTILKLAEERGTERTFAPADVARAMDEKNWFQLIDQVKFVASVLIDEGKIIARETRENVHSEFSKAPVREKH